MRQGGGWQGDAGGRATNVVEEGRPELDIRVLGKVGVPRFSATAFVTVASVRPCEGQFADLAETAVFPPWSIAGW